MKLLLVTLLIALFAFSNADRIPEAEDFLRGLLKGSFGAVGEEVVECIQDGTEILEDLVHVVEDFEQAIVHQDKEALVEALKYIGDILSLLPEELKDCKGVEEFVKDLERIAAEFANPEALIFEIAEKIIWHGRAIYEDVEATVNDFKRDAYEAAGEDVGDIIKIVFLNSGLYNPVDDTVDLMTSFYKAAFSLELNLTTCDAKMTKSADEIINGINELLNATDINQIMTAGMKIYFGGQHLYDSVHDCDEAWPVIEEGIHDMDPFVEHPAKIILAFSEAIALNPIALPKDAYSFYTALTSNPINFKLAGASSGDIIHLLLVHM